MFFKSDPLKKAQDKISNDKLVPKGANLTESKKKPLLKRLEFKGKTIIPKSREILPMDFKKRFHKLLNQQKPFSPSVCKELKAEGSRGYYTGANMYNQKYNMILSCTMDGMVSFYDATTFAQQRRPLFIGRTVTCIAYSAKTEIFFLGCKDGCLYTYDICKHRLDEMPEDYDQIVTAITFLNPDWLAFSFREADYIYLYNLKEEKTFKCSFLKDSWRTYFCNFEKQRIVILGFEDWISAYRTDQLPKLPVLWRMRGHGNHGVQSVMINKREYLISEYHNFIKIFHITKGKIRLLRVIRIKKGVLSYCVVFLENYKMIAVTYRDFDVEFHRILSGKLELRLDVKMKAASDLFFMKEKNCLGVADFSEKVIKILQLSSPN